MLEPKDSLWLDMTDKSPYPMRKNGYTIINKKAEGADSIKDISNEDKFITQ